MALLYVIVKPIESAPTAPELLEAVVSGPRAVHPGFDNVATNGLENC
jgi:hypothetical protein